MTELHAGKDLVEEWLESPRVWGLRLWTEAAGTVQASRNVLLMSNSTWQIIYEFYGGNLWCLRECSKSPLRISSIGEKPTEKQGGSQRHRLNQRLEGHAHRYY